MNDAYDVVLESLLLTWNMQLPAGTANINVRNRDSHALSKKASHVTFTFKVNNRNTRKSCEICAKLTIKTQ